MNPKSKNTSAISCLRQLFSSERVFRPNSPGTRYGELSVCPLVCPDSCQGGTPHPPLGSSLGGSGPGPTVTSAAAAGARLLQSLPGESQGTAFPYRCRGNFATSSATPDQGKRCLKKIFLGEETHPPSPPPAQLFSSPPAPSLPSKQQEQIPPTLIPQGKVRSPFSVSLQLNPVRRSL